MASKINGIFVNFTVGEKYLHNKNLKYGPYPFLRYSSGDIFYVASQEVRPVIILSKHAGAVTSLAWSPDGALLVSGSEDKTAIVWKKDSWEPAAVLNGAHVRSIMALVFSDDGQKIYMGGDRSIVAWNVEGTKDKTIGTMIVDIWTFSIAPGGKYIAAGTFEKKYIFMIW